MQIILQRPPVCQALFFVLGSILGADMQALAVPFTLQAKLLVKHWGMSRPVQSTDFINIRRSKEPWSVVWAPPVLSADQGLH